MYYSNIKEKPHSIMKCFDLFQQYLAMDVTLPVDQVREFVILVTRHVNLVLGVAKSAIMLEDMMKSAKFAFGKKNYALIFFKKIQIYMHSTHC